MLVGVSGDGPGVEGVEGAATDGLRRFLAALMSASNLGHHRMGRGCLLCFGTGSTYVYSGTDSMYVETVPEYTYVETVPGLCK